MFVFRNYHIRSYEMGLLFRDEEFQGLLQAGHHRFFDPTGKVRVDIVSRRDPWLVHKYLDLIIRSGALADDAVVLELQDHQRALVWIDDRFSHVLPPGQYAWWIGHRHVRVEVVDIRNLRFEHRELSVIVKSPTASQVLDVRTIDRDRVGVLFIDGQFVDTLAPGLYAFWHEQAATPSRAAGAAQRTQASANGALLVETLRTDRLCLVEIDQRETTIDVGGQDIMTADKVTLRLNAVVTCRIVDAFRAISRTDDLRQAIYRETQLVLRSVVGACELDAFLAEKDVVATQIEETIRRRAAELGLEIAAIGIRDVILPGEMKDLMNRVTEARKAAEANLISRREETAAMRSQANTARLLADNPVLMRLRELEVLERIAAAGRLNVVLGEHGPGEKGLADRVVNLL